MQFSRKTIAVIALLIVLAASNVAFAVLYMTKNVNITGGVAVEGAIEIYEVDEVTPLTGYDFPMFTGGNSGEYDLDFFVKNTGSQLVFVTWNISSSSISWEISGEQYLHLESSVVKYQYSLFQPDTTSYWLPRTTGAPEETIFLSPGTSKHITLFFFYNGSPATPETFSLVMSFYAKDTSG